MERLNLLLINFKEEIKTVQARTRMSKTMEKYLQDLYLAEFGNDEENIDSNPREFIKLLKRALKWKSLKNLEYVVEYLGAETDERAESIEGCKRIIEEDIDYMINIV